MSKRITKRDYFNELKVVASKMGREDLVLFCDKELALLDRKRNKSGKPTAAQLVNEGIKATIVEILVESDEPMRATVIATDLGESVQKATALLKQLVEANAIERIEEGKVVTFTAYADDE